MQKKYGFLSFAAKVLRVVAWIFLVVGIIVSIYLGISTGSATNGAVGGLMAAIGIIFSFLAWVFLLTARELLYLLMDVEENTRNTAENIAQKSR